MLVVKLLERNGGKVWGLVSIRRFSKSISKSTCIFVVTIVSCFLLEFEKNSSLVKLWYSFFNCSSSVDESTA
jgi:hypothetical protein